jgi:endonuclease/exonuclease/phosphatase family metal-dependent hydrolase
MDHKFRILTYNIHRGLHALTRRSVEHDVQQLLENLKPDIICLQEVWRRDEIIESDLEKFCEARWLHQCFGRNVVFPSGSQGNAILSRYCIQEWRNVDISISGNEPRGILHGTIDCDGLPLNVICTHFGLRHHERLAQLNMLRQYLDTYIANDAPILKLHPRILDLGFCEASLTLRGHLALTYPVWMPVLKLDRVYLRNLEIRRVSFLRNHIFRLHSDHVPYWADLVAITSEPR